jgi:hypothetical protein
MRTRHRLTRRARTHRFIRFTSDGTVQAAGFVATWAVGSAPPTAVPAFALADPTTPCGVFRAIVVQYDTAEGTLSDGGGGEGGRYVPNSLCRWLVGTSRAYEPPGSAPGKAQARGTIVLAFVRMDLEAGYDTVRVYDGSNLELESTRLLGTFSGAVAPQAPLIARSGMAYVEFASDATVAGRGFELRWTSSAADASSPPYSLLVTPPAAGSACSGVVVLRDLTGRFDDGSGAARYEPNALCSWLIEPDLAGSASGEFRLSFDALDLEQGLDVVSVYCGFVLPSEPISRSAPGLVAWITPLTSALLGDFSGSDTATQYSRTVVGQCACVVLVFRTDASIQRDGFVASYTVTVSPVPPSPTPLREQPLASFTQPRSAAPSATAERVFAPAELNQYEEPPTFALATRSHSASALRDNTTAVAAAVAVPPAAPVAAAILGVLGAAAAAYKLVMARRRQRVHPVPAPGLAGVAEPECAECCAVAAAPPELPWAGGGGRVACYAAVPRVVLGWEHDSCCDTAAPTLPSKSPTQSPTGLLERDGCAEPAVSLSMRPYGIAGVDPAQRLGPAYVQHCHADRRTEAPLSADLVALDFERRTAPPPSLSPAQMAADFDPGEVLMGEGE